MTWKIAQSVFTDERYGGWQGRAGSSGRECSTQRKNWNPSPGRFHGYVRHNQYGGNSKRRKYHKNARSSPIDNHCHSSFHLLSSAHVSGFLGFANVYAMRVNLSVAIVAMVQDANSTHPSGNITTPLPGNLTTTHHHANHTTTTHHHGNSTTTTTITTTTSKTTKPATTTSSPTTENHDSFFGTMFFSRKGWVL